MSIRSKILSGCAALTLIACLLGAYAQWAEAQLGSLALRIYDDAFMGVSYLRSAQVGFATLTAASSPGAHDGTGISDILGDLDVARDRAMSAEGRGAAESLAKAVKAADGQPDQAPAIQAQFEQVVEIFAGDGFRYRRNVGALVTAQARETSIVVALAVLAAILITLLLTKLIAPPVRRAVAIAQAIAAGRLDNVIPVSGNGETAELLRALSTMQASISPGIGAYPHADGGTGSQSCRRTGQATCSIGSRA